MSLRRSPFIPAAPPPPVSAPGPTGGLVTAGLSDLMDGPGDPGVSSPTSTGGGGGGGGGPVPLASGPPLPPAPGTGGMGPRVVTAGLDGGSFGTDGGGFC
jgi:hypothetical protein